MQLRRLFPTVLFIMILASLGGQGSAWAQSVQQTVVSVQTAAYSIDRLHMADELNGWAYTTDNGLLHTTDGGITWTEIHPPAGELTTRGSFFLDGQTAWLLTGYAGILRTTDGGQTWSNFPGMEGDVYSYTYVSVNDGWAEIVDGAAGSIYIQFYETHDGGATFSPAGIVDPGELPNTLHIAGLCGDAYHFDFTKLIVAGGNVSCGDSGAPYIRITHNRGQSWRTFDLAYPSIQAGARARPHEPIFITDAEGLLPVDFFYGSSYDDYTLIVYVTHDGGDTWTLAAGQLHLTGYQPMLQFVSPDDGFVLCGDSLCATHDGAMNWEEIDSDLDFTTDEDRQIVEMQFVNATTGWLILKENGIYSLFKTTDGGFHWLGPGTTSASADFEGQIAYVGVDGDVYLLRGGQPSLRVTNEHGGRSFKSPAFSQSGRWLSFLDEGNALQIVDTTSSDFQVIHRTADVESFEWAHHSDKLAFVVNSTLKIFDAVQLQTRDLFPTATLPSWSWDDGEIAVAWTEIPCGTTPPDDTHTSPPGSKVFLVDPATGSGVEIFQDVPGGFILEIATSPDSSHFFLTRCGCFSECGFDQAITRSGEFDRTIPVIWSPDAQWAYGYQAVNNMSGGGYDTEVFRVRPDGSQRERLYYSAGDATITISLSPDGQALLIETGRAIDGYLGPGIEQPRLGLLDVVSQAYRQIGSQELQFIAWSPTGRGLLVSDGFYGNPEDVPYHLAILGVFSGRFVLQGMEIGSSNGPQAAWGKLPPGGTAAGMYDLSGNVHEMDGTPLTGVSILLDGIPAGTTDQAGNYSITEVGEGEHTVEPVLEGWVFSPGHKTRDVLGDMAGLDFYGEELPRSIAEISLELKGEPKAVQNLLQTEPCEPVTPGGTYEHKSCVPLIVGKPTMLRFCFDNTSGQDLVVDATLYLFGEKAEARVTLTGQTLSTDPDDDPVTPDDCLEFIIPQSIWGRSIEYYLEISPEDANGMTYRYPQYNVGEVLFTETKVLNVAYVNVGWNPYPILEKPFYQSMAIVRDLFPISGINYYPMIVPEGYMLANETGAKAIISSLRFLWNYYEAKNWNGVTPADQLVGLLSRDYTDSHYADGAYSDPVFDGGQGHVAYITDYPGYSYHLAHELAHNMGRHHVWEVRTEALVFDYCDVPGDGEWPYDDLGINAYGLRFFGPERGWLWPEKTADIVNSFSYLCVDTDLYPYRWISPYTYNGLFTEIRSRNWIIGNPMQGNLAALPRIPINQKLALNDQEVVLISGRIESSGSASIYSVFQMPAISIGMPEDAGDYSISLEDIEGNILSSTNFNVSYVNIESGDLFPWAGFSEVLPYDPTARFIRLRHLGEIVAERSYSLNAPTITLVTPGGGEYISEPFDVTWQASDPDGDSLTYYVEYSPDAGQSWVLLAAGISETQMTLDPADVSGSTMALIRVTASDGANSASDLPETTFSLAPHAPTAMILEPADGATWAPGNVQILTGSGYDLEDGILNGEALQWYLGEEYLGSGDLLQVTAPGTGNYLLTLMVIDQDGNTAQSGVTITIGSAQPEGNGLASPEKPLAARVVPVALGIILGVGVLGLAGVMVTTALQKHKRGMGRMKQSKAPTLKSAGENLRQGLGSQERIREPGDLRLAHAKGLAQAGQYRDAAEILAEIVKDDAGNSDVWLYLGFTSARLGDSAYAGQCFRQAEKLGNPKAAQALAWLGREDLGKE